MTDIDEKKIRNPKTGQFLPGAPIQAGPGRPKGSAHFLRVLRETVEPHWPSIINAQAIKASRGDSKAAMFLGKYVVPNAAPMPQQLTGELMEQLGQLKVALADGETDGRTASVLARIVALESVIARSSAEGNVLSIAEINQILNTEVEV